MIIHSLPGTSARDIKDGGRAIAKAVLGEQNGAQNKADSIGAALRELLNNQIPNSNILETILFLANENREEVIKCLAEKECIRRITGASKREKEARGELAEKVLDEIVGKIESVLAKK
ncbi:hypothetical protein KA071_03170 [Candidatus Gracilibacteria bacterium]|nr:hypothetical protein [Candidatus Gracilibacteria bacterium]